MFYGLKKPSLYLFLITSFFSQMGCNSTHKTSSLNSNFSHWKVSPGEIYKGFRVERIEWIPDIKSQVFHLNHEQSGAQLIFLSNKDTNKAFSINFKTPPYDNTGVFHIFEHSVLAGSKRYPSKSLFFSLSASSLAQELNAMTFRVSTQYFFASKVEKDFSNLLKAYLDSVFYPNVLSNPNILKREGFRIEWSETKKDFKYNGIVLNELKGALFIPRAHLYPSIFKSLVFQTPYAFQSVGKIENIVDVTFKQIKEIHKKYYHPDNSLIYLYGNINIQNTLSTIHEMFLKNFKKRENFISPQIKTQNIFKPNKVFRYSYPVTSPKEDLKRKTFIALNYLFGKGIPLEDRLSLEIIGSAIFNKENSPGKKLIRRLDLAKDIAFHNYFYNYWQIQQNPSSIVLTNTNHLKNKKKIKEQIETLLKNFSKKGLDQKIIESTLNAHEFSLKESLFNSPYRWWQLENHILAYWIQKDYELKEMLEFNKRFSKVRKKLKNQNHVQSLLKKYFVENKKRSFVVLSPNLNLIKNLEKKLNQKLKKTIQKEGKEKLKKEDQEFKKWLQAKEPENITNKTPHLNSSSLSSTVEKIKYQRTLYRRSTPSSHEAKESHPIEIYTFPQNTGGISYIDLHFNLSHIPEKNLLDLSLILYLLKKTNTKKRDSNSLTSLLNENLGGLSFKIKTFTPIMNQTQSSHSKIHTFKPYLIVSSKFLNQKSTVSFQLIQEILTQSFFEPEDQVKNLILELITNKRASVTERGFDLADLSAAAYFSESAKWMTYINGHMAEKFLRNLEKDILKNKTAIKDVIQRLKKTLSLLFHQNNLELIAVVGEKEDLKKTHSLSQNFISHLKYFSKNGPNLPLFLKKASVLKSYKPIDGFEIPSQVQHIQMKLPYFQLNQKLNGKLHVFSNILREYLIKVIREQNGAYVARASFTPQGIFSLSSSRDPKLKNTLNTFESFPKFFDSLKLDQKSLDPYIVGSLKTFYQAQSPYGKARHFLNRKLIGLNEKDYQRIKKEILSTTVKDIQKINSNMKKIISKAKITVVGEKEKIAKEAPFIKEKMAL